MFTLTHLLWHLANKHISASLELRATLVMSNSPLANELLSGVTGEQAAAIVEELGLQHQEARINGQMIEGKNSISGGFVLLFTLDDERQIARELAA